MDAGMPSAEPRVLVVDDEPAIRRFLRAGLTARAIVVIEAGDRRRGARRGAARGAPI